MSESIIKTLALPRWRLHFTILVLLAQVAVLLWEHTHGGIVSHHLLGRADMPAVSNAWGLLLLPALAWLACTFVLRRMAIADGTNSAKLEFPISAVLGFSGALLVGALLSFGFSQGFENFTAMLFQLLFLLALVLPLYRAEALLGFVLGMTLTIGPILPAAVGSILVALSAVAHFIAWPLLRRGWRSLRRFAAIR